MGEKSGEERQPEPNLELPSIFGRRKKRRRAEPDAPEQASGARRKGVTTEEPSSSPAEQEATEPHGAQTGATADVPAARRTDAADPGVASPPAANADRAAPTNSATRVTAPEGRPTAPAESDATRRLPEVAESAGDQTTLTESVAPEPTPRPEVADAALEQSTLSEPVMPVTAPRSEVDTPSDSTADSEDVTEPVSSAPSRATGRRTTERPGSRRAARPSGPLLPGPVAAVLTGLVVGLFGAGATYGGTQACDAWRGTSSCGGGPGLLLLIAILALMVLVGGVLLALLGVPEPRSTSFLGVGLTFVVVLVALMSAVFSIWMFFAAPVLSAVAYGVAHWVTTRHVELPETGPDHDVR